MMTEHSAESDAVHVGHCCRIHGCKYGDEDCAVQSGNARQRYMCEFCRYILDDAEDRLRATEQVRQLQAELDATSVASPEAGAE